MNEGRSTTEDGEGGEDKEGLTRKPRLSLALINNKKNTSAAAEMPGGIISTKSLRLFGIPPHLHHHTITHYVMIK